jgi:hypothetical protein
MHQKTEPLPPSTSPPTRRRRPPVRPHACPPLRGGGWPAHHPHLGAAGLQRLPSPTTLENRCRLELLSPRVRCCLEPPLEICIGRGRCPGHGRRALLLSPVSSSCGTPCSLLLQTTINPPSLFSVCRQRLSSPYRTQQQGVSLLPHLSETMLQVYLDVAILTLASLCFSIRWPWRHEP